MKAIRGAIATVTNQAGPIGDAARILVEQICASNNLTPQDFVMLLFSCTKDLDAAYPAPAVREAGFSQVPLMCLQEMQVNQSLPGCIRVLALVRPDLPIISHVYLGEATRLRPDWVGDNHD